MKVLLALIGLASAACAAHPPQSGSDVQDRCFTADYTNWSSGGEGRAYYEPLPQVIRLSNAVDSLGRDSSRIGYRTPLGPEGTKRIWWQRTGVDSVMIWLPRGWSSGLTLRLGPRNASALSFRGHLQDYADYSPRTTLRADVTLTSVVCRDSASRGG